jgi:hypothetical protein
VTFSSSITWTPEPSVATPFSISSTARAGRSQPPASISAEATLVVSFFSSALVSLVLIRSKLLA